MIVNSQSLDLAFKGFKAIYSDAYTAAPAHFEKVAMTVPSGARDETYGWLGQFPQLDIKAHGFTIANKKFESTLGIKREDFADDRYGVFKPMFAEMGHLARQHPDELVFGLLKDGFTELGYDGQPFFDTDHPAKDETGADVTVSNVQAGSDPAWFLLDTSRAVKPLIWQEREKYDFQKVTSPTDSDVFMTDLYRFGVRARVNAGLGLWQLAFGSKAALTADNYAAARAAMQMLRGDQGRVLGVNPTVLVVSPQLEDAARKVLNTETNDGGGSNPWKGTAELIVTPYVA